MAHCYMSTSLLLRLFCSLLFLVPIFSSRAIPDVDDTAYIRLPSSSSVEVTNFGSDGDGGDIYEYSSSDVLPQVKGAPNRDFLVLALQWPKAMCTRPEVCRLTPLSFTIHGLWGSIPNEKCPAVTYDAALLNDPLRRELQIYWVNAKATSKAEYQQLTSALVFWGYEWKKHGGCTDLAQVAYFEKALQLIKANDVTKIVMDNFRGNINQGLRVNTANLRSKVDTGLGGITSMVCSAASAGCFLQEFRLYIRTSDWKVINYPTPLSCNCPNGVLFANTLN